MTKLTFKALTTVALLAAMSACSSTTDGASPDEDMTPGDDTDGDVTPPTPTEPTISFEDVSAARVSIAAIADNSGTPAGNYTNLGAPSGAVSYTGSFVTDLELSDGNTVDGLIGDMAISVAFDASNDVTGAISNLHTLDGSVPQESLGGSLAVSGDINPTDRTLTAAATGTLTGVLGQETRGDLAIATDLAGDYGYTIVQEPSTLLPVGIFDDATGFAGQATGTVSGHVTGNIAGDWAVETATD